MMALMRDFHDASSRLWYDHSRMIEDLLRGFVPADLVEAFDFDSLEQLPAQHVGDDRRQSRGDMLWRVRFRDRATGEGEWLYLLVLLEFQSTVDRHMAVRVLAYTAQTLLRLVRGGGLPADGKLPPVLPVVIYNGRTRWSAPEEVSETIAEVGAGLAPFQPRQRYLLLDQHAMRVEALPPGNVVSAQIELEQGAVPGMAPVLRDLGRLLSGAEHASLRRAFASWTRETVARSRVAVAHPRLVGALEALEGEGDLDAMGSLLAERIDEYVETRSLKRGLEQGLERGLEQGLERGLEQGREQGLERGLEQGLEQGLERGLTQGLERGLTQGLEQERALLSRQAARKFDARTASRLAALLDGIADPERLAEIGEQVIDCATGAELLARAERAAGRG